MDDRTFRDTMGKFATGITVVTIKDDTGTISGMTVNAFMSVSLHPKLIAVSIGENASLFNQFVKSKQIGISVLSENQKDYSMIFSRQKEEDRDIPYTDLAGAPVIKDALATISCKITDSFKAGDHTIFIAEVIDLDRREGHPLLYFGGSYRTVKKDD
ncbi:MAG TPA: flavin reductase family protein [Cerasibacillus sp.]|uniref:flavin reductase family protein n=1 Tax=Cerasibacillus sp. TaxID=2498711 RepID=UPI002F413546